MFFAFICQDFVTPLKVKFHSNCFHILGLYKMKRSLFLVFLEINEPEIRI